MISTPNESQAPDESSSEMRPTPARASHLLSALSAVQQRISAASPNRPVRLIAVSKLKPASDILALHQPENTHSDPPSSVVEHFGENYAQELTQKSQLLPRSIKWHMIGALQTNKCKPLAEQVPNLYCVSSVDTVKKANELEKGRKALHSSSSSGDETQAEDGRLRVLVQVNTSGESNKSGVAPSETAALCRHIRSECPHLRLAGLMTIGAIARSQSEGVENEDFICLRETRDAVAQELDLPAGELELSMGMSADFEAAIKQGSDEVRIGTTIFGERPRREDARIT